MKSNTDAHLLTVVVPVYNEAESLPSFAPLAIDYCKARGWDIIFVNDGSRDGTKNILDELAEKSPVRVVHHKVNRGYGGALKTGFQHVSTKFLVTIDGDGQHILDDVESIFQFAVENDADMVVGKREEQNISTIYRALGKLLIRSFTKILMVKQRLKCGQSIKNA